MDTVTHLVTGVFKAKHSKGQKITRSSLDPRLEYARPDELITPPDARVGVLAGDCDTELLGAPWCGDQLSLWPLPTDQTLAG